MAVPQGSGGTGAAGGSVDGGNAGSGGAGDAGPPLVCPSATTPASASYAVDASGVTFTLNPGRLRLQVCKEDIIRVEYTTAAAFSTKASLSVNKTWAPTSFCVAEAAGVVTITTARMKAKVDTATGTVSYTDLSDKVVLSEDSKTLTAATVEGVSTNRVQTVFNSPADEGLFGLGQHQDSVVNRKGKNQHILNVNTQINIPVLVSSKGYGIFWDNYSTSDFYGGESSSTKYRYQSEAGDMVDYYFFYGPSIDQVVALYRTATGPAPLFSQVGLWSLSVEGQIQ